MVSLSFFIPTEGQWNAAPPGLNGNGRGKLLETALLLSFSLAKLTISCDIRGHSPGELLATQVLWVKGLFYLILRRNLKLGG